MLDKLPVLIAATFILSACQQPEQAAAPPPPPPSAAKSFLVFFEWNSTNLSAQAVDILKQAAASYRTSGNAPVSDTGHADRSGTDAYNMALSQRRANVVRDALGREGVPPAAITTLAKGESQPLVPTADGVREPQNRRVEIVVGQMVASNDQIYCKEMSARYRRYLGQASTEGDVAKAMYDCDQGNTAAAIPVLEKALTDAKLSLPPRV